MPQWREMYRQEVDDLTVFVKERWDRRNRLGATEYIITVERDGTFLHSERHPWNVWAGHCSGALLIPRVIKNAKRRLAARTSI